MIHRETEPRTCRISIVVENGSPESITFTPQELIAVRARSRRCGYTGGSGGGLSTFIRAVGAAGAVEFKGSENERITQAAAALNIPRVSYLRLIVLTAIGWTNLGEYTARAVHFVATHKKITDAVRSR